MNHEPDYTPQPLNDKSAAWVNTNIESLEKQIVTCKAALLMLNKIKKTGSCDHPIGYRNGGGFADAYRCTLCDHRIY